MVFNDNYVTGVTSRITTLYYSYREGFLGTPLSTTTPTPMSGRSEYSPLADARGSHVDFHFHVVSDGRERGAGVGGAQMRSAAKTTTGARFHQQENVGV